MALVVVHHSEPNPAESWIGSPRTGNRATTWLVCPSTRSTLCAPREATQMVPKASATPIGWGSASFVTFFVFTSM